MSKQYYVNIHTRSRIENAYLALTAIAADLNSHANAIERLRYKTQFSAADQGSLQAALVQLRAVACKQVESDCYVLAAQLGMDLDK